jgi:hypothetical protein
VSDIYVDASIIPAGNPVIRVNGNCYEFVENSQLAPDTIAIEGDFIDCESCEASPSPAFSPSPPNACASQVCANGWPSMQISIQADDVDLPITWCGKTWVASTVTPGANQAHSGEFQCVCPSTYTLPVAYANQNHWGGPGGELNLFHSTQFGFIALRRVDMSPTNFVSSAKSVCVGTQNNCADTSTGVFAGSPVRGCLPKATPGPGVANAFIEDCQFFSHMVGGVKYTWRRGINW